MITLFYLPLVKNPLRHRNQKKSGVFSSQTRRRPTILTAACSPGPSTPWPHACGWKPLARTARATSVMQPPEITTRLFFLIIMEKPCASLRDHSSQGNGRFYRCVGVSVHKTNDRLSRWHKQCQEKMSRQIGRPQYRPWDMWISLKPFLDVVKAEVRFSRRLQPYLDSWKCHLR